MSIRKNVHEGFARFFETPTRQSLRELLANSIGETDQIDFKAELPEKPKLAKHLLGLANSNGGVLILGVSEDEALTATGVEEIVDKADIHKMVAPYIPSSLTYEVLDFYFDATEYPQIKGKSFQVIIVESDPKCLPYLSLRAGEGIKDNSIYVRKGTNTTEATHDDVQRVINARLETGYSSSSVIDLEEHLAQLRALYATIPQYHSSLRSVFSNFAQRLGALYDEKPNPNYPDEGFEPFIARLIAKKKIRIEKVLDL